MPYLQHHVAYTHHRWSESWYVQCICRIRTLKVTFKFRKTPNISSAKFPCVYPATLDRSKISLHYVSVLARILSLNIP